MLYQTCKLCVPYVTICWGIFFKRNNTGTMFNWHHHYQPTSNRLCLSLGGQSWQCLLQNTRAWDTWPRGSRWGRTGSWRSRRWPSRRRTKLSTRATPTSTMRATTSTLALAFLSRQWVFCNASHFPTHDSGLVQLSVTFAVNSSLSAQLRRFSLFFFFKPCLTQPQPPIGRVSVRLNKEFLIEQIFKDISR